MLRRIFAAIAFFLSIGAQADQHPDLYCLPAQAWDIGYTITLNKISGGYWAQLDQILLQGLILKHAGYVHLEVSKPTPGCTLKINGETNSFELQMIEDGDNQLITALGETVSATIGKMSCMTSPAFSADVANLCRN